MKFSSFLDDPEIATERAIAAIRRAQSISAQAQSTHERFVDVLARRHLMHISDQLDMVSLAGRSALRSVGTLQQRLTARPQPKMSPFVSALSRACLNHVIRSAEEAFRSMTPLIDLSARKHGVPSKLDAAEPPRPLSFQPDRQPKRTAAGCVCDSQCRHRGRPFTWCPVSRDKACPVAVDLVPRDAAGADHRVAGVNDEYTSWKIWDYCDPHPPQDLAPIAVHAGGYCAPRFDLLRRYLSDATFHDENGELKWPLIPNVDRLALEAMISHEQARETGALAPLCTRTPSSGPFHVCPIQPMDWTGTQSSPLTWAGSRNWDFCVPPLPPRKNGQLFGQILLGGQSPAVSMVQVTDPRSFL